MSHIFWWGWVKRFCDDSKLACKMSKYVWCHLWTTLKSSFALFQNADIDFLLSHVTLIMFFQHLILICQFCNFFVNLWNLSKMEKSKNQPSKALEIEIGENSSYANFITNHKMVTNHWSTSTVIKIKLLLEKNMLLYLGTRVVWRKYTRLPGLSKVKLIW